MNWKFHLVAQNVAAVLPFQRYRRRLSRRNTKPAERMRLLESAVERAIQQVELIRQHGIDPKGRIGMEIGTGWHPINAMVQSLAGARRVYLVNSTVEYDQESVLSAVYQLSQWSAVLAQRLGVEEEEVQRRCALSGARGVGEVFQSFGLVSLAPADARNLDLESGTIDYLTSHNTLARVPPAVLDRLVAEWTRLLYPSGVMCHQIDNSDPWAQKDRSISKVHFLRHSEAFWAFCCMNQQNYRNRLRHSQYRAVFEKAGFEILHQSKKVDAKSLSVLSTMRVAEPFTRIPEKDLCAVSSSFVLQKASAARDHTATDEPRTETLTAGTPVEQT